MKSPSFGQRCVVITLCLLVFLYSGVTPLQAETFRNARRIVTGGDPSSINVADLNGDGHPDLLYGIATNSSETGTGSIHTLLWQAGNVYVAGPVLHLPSDTNTLCRTGDLNGDGLPDLLCPSVKVPEGYTGAYSTSMVFFAGKGDGSFGTPVYSPVIQTGGNYSLAYPLISTFADTNRDGKQDVLVVDPQAGSSYILLGNGGGGFSFSQHVSTGNGVSQLLDVNGDGIPDLLLTDGPTVQLGKGDGTFGPIVSSGALAIGCAYGDVDGDGRPDAVCAYLQGTGSGLYVLHGRGDGTFNPVPVVSDLFPDGSSGAAGMAILSAALQVTDLNGDGVPDILGAGGDGWTTVVGHAGLTFDYPRNFAAGYEPGAAVFSRFYPLYQLVDLDGDGRPDLVTAGPNGIYIMSLQNPLSQQPPEAVAVSEPGYTVGYAAVADFDGDGIPDVAASGSKDLTFSKGVGDGTFHPPKPVANAGLDFSTPITATRAALLAGDFFGDGKQSLLAIGSPSIYSYQPYLLRGHGDGTFSVPTLVALPVSYFYTGANRPVLDINKDGRDDVVYFPNSTPGTSVPTLSIALSNGDGTFRTVSTIIPSDTSGADDFFAFADFDGDGKLDSVYAGANHAYVLAGNGDGTFNTTTPRQLAIPNLPGQNNLSTSSVTTGDFDGDGRADFVLLTSYGSSASTVSIATGCALTVFYGNGDGTFAQAVQQTYPRIYTDVLGVDVDKDGRTDFVLNSGGTFDPRAVAIVHGRQDRTFGPETDYYAGGALSTMAASDLNGDGFPDLLSANGDLNVRANSVTVLMNLGNAEGLSGTLTATPEPSTAGQPFQIVAMLNPAAGEVLSGQISFQVDGTAIGSATLSGNTASVSGPTGLTAGTHALSAAWAGDAAHSALTLSGSHTVTALPLRSSAVILSSSPSTIYAGQTITLTASVTDVLSGTTPAGTVSFTDGAVVLGTAALGIDGHATLAMPLSVAGIHTITAAYNGDSSHQGAKATASVQVLKLPMTLVLSSAVNPSTAFIPVVFTVRLASAQLTTLTFNQPVILHDGGNLLSASGTLAASGDGSLTVSGLSAGSHTIVASFAGNSNMEAAVSAPLVQVEDPIATVVLLSAASNPAYQGQTVTMTAIVGNYGAAAGLAPLTGVVRFLDGGVVLGEVSLSGGTAAFSTATLAVGAHALTAIYLGDLNHAGSTSASVTENIVASDLVLSADPTSLSLQTQHHMTFMLKAASVGFFADTVAFGTWQLPQHATVQYSTAAASLSAGTSVSVPVHLDTSDVLGYLARENNSHGPVLRCILASLVAFPLGLLLAARKVRGKSALLLLTLAILSGFASGCSSKYPSSVAPGMYTLHLTATGKDTGIIRTLDIPLNVTP